MTIKVFTFITFIAPSDGGSWQSSYLLASSVSRIVTGMMLDDWFGT